MINVSIGDPSVYNDFLPNKEVLNYLSETIDNNNGYVDFEGIKVIIIW